MGLKRWSSSSSAGVAGEGEGGGLLEMAGEAKPESVSDQTRMVEGALDARACSFS